MTAQNSRTTKRASPEERDELHHQQGGDLHLGTFPDARQWTIKCSIFWKFSIVAGIFCSRDSAGLDWFAMNYTMNFGRLSSQSAPPRSPGKTFRIAVMGDFSGRANGGTLETGADLAKRKPIRIDVDNLEAVLGRMNLRLNLPIAADGSIVEVKIASIDDFHPDQLYNQLEIFTELAGLRRRLKNSSTFDAAAAEVRSWGHAASVTTPAPARRKPRGTAIPHGKLDDFAHLIGRTTAAAPPAPVQRTN